MWDYLFDPKPNNPLEQRVSLQALGLQGKHALRKTPTPVSHSSTLRVWRHAHCEPNCFTGAQLLRLQLQSTTFLHCVCDGILIASQIALQEPNYCAFNSSQPLFYTACVTTCSLRAKLIYITEGPTIAPLTPVSHSFTLRVWRHAHCELNCFTRAQLLHLLE